MRSELRIARTATFSFVVFNRCFRPLSHFPFLEMFLSVSCLEHATRLLMEPRISSSNNSITDGTTISSSKVFSVRSSQSVIMVIFRSADGWSGLCGRESSLDSIV